MLFLSLYPLVLLTFIGAVAPLFSAPNTAKSTASIASEKVTFNALNSTIGYPLFRDDNLWDDAVTDVAKALPVQIESKTAYQASYRGYADKNTRLLGARPYSIAFYARDDLPDSLSIVYVNKGDLPQAIEDAGEKITREKDMLRFLNETLRKDQTTLHSKLTALLGKPITFQMGQDALKETTDRWDWLEHSFLLSSQPNGYMNLRILPKEVADGRGRAQWTPSYQVKERMKSDLLRKENGDVLVQQLPMVDQGPKGYCVPATFERVLRYFNIPADMYTLALVAKSGIGEKGGTYLSDMLKTVELLVKRSGRKLISFKTKITIGNIDKYINDGIPIMWIMSATDTYQERLNNRNKIRRNITQWSDWEKELSTARRSAKTLKIEKDFSHLCLIVGYNKKTGEIAVSDSYGKAFEARWLLPEEAERVSYGECYVITF